MNNTTTTTNTQTNWADIESKISRSKPASQWLKLGDGEAIVVKFHSDGDVVENNFKSLRFRISVTVLSTGDIKIWDAPLSMQPTLKQFDQKYGFANTAFELRRQGSGKDTTYSILFERTLPQKA